MSDTGGVLSEQVGLAVFLGGVLLAVVALIGLGPFDPVPSGVQGAAVAIIGAIIWAYNRW